jgi:hypothetical protein
MCVLSQHRNMPAVKKRMYRGNSKSSLDIIGFESLSNATCPIAVLTYTVLIFEGEELSFFSIT